MDRRFHVWIIVFSFHLIFCVQKTGSVPVFAQQAPTTDLEQLDFANGLFQREFYDMAITEYKNFLSTFPESQYLSEAYFGIGESLFFSGHHQEAISSYQDFVNRFPDSDKINLCRLRMGQCYYLAGEIDEALALLNNVDPERLENQFKQVLFYHKARVFEAKKQYKDALEFFTQITSDQFERNQYTDYAFMEIGKIYKEQGQYDQALSYFDRAFTESKNDNIRALALYRKGETFFAAGNYPSAEQVFYDVSQKFSSDESVKDALSNWLLAIFNQEAYQRVIDEYNKNAQAVGQTADYSKVYFVVASAYVRLERYAEALAVIDKILGFEDLDPVERNKAAVKKMETLVYSKQYQHAVDWAGQSLNGSEENPDYVAYLTAEAWYGLNDYEKAYPFYQKVIDANAGSAFALEALYGMAHAKNHLNQSEEAMVLFQKYFTQSTDPAKRAKALYNAFSLALQLEQTDTAIQFAQDYLQAFPDGEHKELIEFHLGSLYHQNSQWDKAVEILGQFIKDFPESPRLPQVYFLIGFCYQSMEKAEDAIEYYKKIPPYDETKELRYSSLKNQAGLYLKMREDGKAAGLFDEIMKSYPDNDLDLHTYLWLAKFYMEQGKHDEALVVLGFAETQKTKGQPDASIAYFQAECYHARKEYAKALERYDVVISLTPEGEFAGPSMIGKALSLSGLNRDPEARDVLSALVEKFPDNPTLTMRARFETAGIDWRIGKLQDAANLFMLVAVLYNDAEYCPRALFHAGEIFETLGQPAEAAKAYSEIIRNYPLSDVYEKVRQKQEHKGAGL